MIAVTLMIALEACSPTFQGFSHVVSCSIDLWHSIMCWDHVWHEQVGTRCRTIWCVHSVQFPFLFFDVYFRCELGIFLNMDSVCSLCDCYRRWFGHKVTLFPLCAVAKESVSSSLEPENTDELEQIRIARALLGYRLKEKVALANSPSGSIPFMLKFPSHSPRPTSPQPPSAATSKILPLICPKSHRNRFSASSSLNDNAVPTPKLTSPESRGARPNKFPAAGAAPYVPIRSFRTTCRGIAPAVSVRTVMPVFSAPPRPPPQRLSSPMAQAATAPPTGLAPPVCLRQAVPVFTAPLARKEDATPSPVHKEPQVVTAIAPAEKESPTLSVISVAPSDESVPRTEEETADTAGKNQEESEVSAAVVLVQGMKELKVWLDIVIFGACKRPHGMMLRGLSFSFRFFPFYFVFSTFFFLFLCGVVLFRYYPPLRVSPTCWVLLLPKLVRRGPLSCHFWFNYVIASACILHLPRWCHDRLISAEISRII